MNARSPTTLTLPLLALAACLLVCVAAIHFSHTEIDKAQQRLTAQQALLREARLRVQKSGDEQDIILRYQNRYRTLLKTGFIGDEQRINWLDALRVVNQKAGLFGVSYQIAPQQPYVFSSELSPGPISVRQSVMKLRFALLHEGDLTQFFELLSQQNSGIYVPELCTIQRTPGSPTMRYQPNLVAECELSWLTVKPAEGTEPQS
jgi:hypothetical protein